MGFLVNDGDKLTKERKIELRIINQEKYGLTDEELTAIKLPPRTDCKIYSIDKIIHARSRLSTIEKILHLKDLQKALSEKLDKLKRDK